MSSSSDGRGRDYLLMVSVPVAGAAPAGQSVVLVDVQANDALKFVAGPARLPTLVHSFPFT